MPTADEIGAACAALADELGLQESWVSYHVRRMAGAPCRRCGGTGYFGGGVCFRCWGYGGKSTPSAVAAALTWVRENRVRVAALGAERDEGAASRLLAASAASARWKADHEREWTFLQGMPDSPFKESLVRAVEAATVTEAQEAALRAEVARAELDSALAPLQGSAVCERFTVTRCSERRDDRGVTVVRVELRSEEGWRARYEARPQDSAWRLSPGERVEVRGRVAWSSGGYAVLEGATVNPGSPVPEPSWAW